jgi:hypothetical protein
MAEEPSKPSPQEQVLKAVRAIAEANGANDGESVDRMVVRMLMVAWADAVRAEWKAYVDADPELKAQHAVAGVLMSNDGYDGTEPVVCGVPGAKPFVCVVDGKESICLDWSMRQAVPLSAIYVDKVRTVQAAAERVALARAAKALAEEASAQPVVENK